ncbi:MAG: beta-hydroxyacid dehydrogenase, 3-hydroxyisobuty rate dehydrogenase, partial [Agromyces sp.]|nr:beta-hydroxyacid dehydrogenase, 3-hydroxyisobuty rate dehydrogenase [Agromyces sp.]
IGFLGLGNMGRAMAGRLLAAGHEVVVWNRSPEAADELVASGAALAAGPAEALAAPISFSMLANDEAAESVLTADHLRGDDGRVHVNMASISAAAADRLQLVHVQAGVGYVAAPVLGRPTVAEAGKLNIMAAGPAELIDRVEPLLDELSVRVWRFGDVPRRANVTKAAVNFMILHALQALGESITLVEAHDIDASDFVELLTNSLFGGVVYSGYGPMIAERRYTPAGFSMALGLKDLGLAEALAEEKGITLPTAPVIRDRFERALADDELQDVDWSGVAEVTRRR